MGVSTLLFAECDKTNNTVLPPGGQLGLSCTVSGASTGDVAVATTNGGGVCIGVTNAEVSASNTVSLRLNNNCKSDANLGTATIAIVVFDKETIIMPLP